MQEDERINTAYHESGHAIVAKSLPKADPVHKVTIMPRGWALGLTWQLPEFDRFSNFKDKMLEEISILFGVTLPRPRDLDVTYSQEFQDVVHDLRSMIGGQH